MGHSIKLTSQSLGTRSLFDSKFLSPGLRSNQEIFRAVKKLKWSHDIFHLFYILNLNVYQKSGKKKT